MEYESMRKEIRRLHAVCAAKSELIKKLARLIVENEIEIDDEETKEAMAELP